MGERSSDEPSCWVNNDLTQFSFLVDSGGRLDAPVSKPSGLKAASAISFVKETERYNKLSQVTTIVCRPFQTTHTLRYNIQLRTSRLLSRTTNTSVTGIRDAARDAYVL